MVSGRTTVRTLIREHHIGSVATSCVLIYINNSPPELASVDVIEVIQQRVDLDANYLVFTDRCVAGPGHECFDGIAHVDHLF